MGRQVVNTSLVAQMLKNLPMMQETWVRPLGQEDPLEKEMTNQSSTLAWKIPWTEEPGRLLEITDTLSASLGLHPFPAPMSGRMTQT